ncbi:unnamed protein product [Malus baccata var. baccata]
MSYFKENDKGGGNRFTNLVAKSQLEAEARRRGLLQIYKSLGGNESATIRFHDWDGDGISKAMADEHRHHPIL